MLLRIEADRKVHGLGHALDLEAAVGDLVVEIGLVLEGVGLEFARGEGLVRHHVVGELDDLQVEALLGRDRLHGLEDLGMRTGRHADPDGLGPRHGRQADHEGQEGGEPEGLEGHWCSPLIRKGKGIMRGAGAC